MDDKFDTTHYFEIVDKNGRFFKRADTCGEALDVLPEGDKIWEVRRMKMAENSVIVETIYRRLVKRLRYDALGVFARVSTCAKTLYVIEPNGARSEGNAD